MPERIQHLTQKDWAPIGAVLVSVVLFYVILMLRIPSFITQYFHEYSIGLFVIVLALYYGSFRLRKLGILVCLALTLSLFALTLSYKWTSGYSDSKVVAGFLPYKDGAGYYLGADLILNGLPLENSAQAGWRPLFSGFLSTLLVVLRGNLMWALAWLEILAAIGTFCASRQVLISFGVLPASLFITLLYFYIQPLIGLTMTELLGYSLGCFAFILLWRTSYRHKISDILLGLSTLTLALSVRAGAFFMLPLLALWVGRMFRGSAKFSIRFFMLAILTMFLSYYIFNSLYARWMGVPPGTVFGNFAYSLYGQVQGGTGWHRAIEELGTVNASIIYKAAFQFFLSHPQSLLIGIAKSYRDFFLPHAGSIFVFDVDQRYGWINFMAWVAIVFLLIRGVRIILKDTASNTSLLLLAGLVGTLLSIPFLPPIDGGSRFYASSAPFFFVIPAAGLNRDSIIDGHVSTSKDFLPEDVFFRITLLSLSIMTVVTPLLILRLTQKPSFSVPACGSDQVPFVMKYYPGSYVDLISKSGNCGFAPEICLGDLDKHSVERTVDDFYIKLYSLVSSASANVRIIPALNFVDKKFHYYDFYLEDVRPYQPFGLISGCAVEHLTKNQSIYQVISILSDRK